MAQIVDVPARPARHGSAYRPAPHRRPFGLLEELERPGDVFRDLGPNWYASIMGTGIVAIAGADLPFRVPGMRTFATAVLALAAAITIRTLRRGMPFGLTWWSFTFPVGTVVTGTIALAARTDAIALRWATVPLYLLLLAAWLTVAARTARGTATGRLFQPMPAPAPVSRE
jgi:tellurite resistance protein TehA-like permease